MGTGPRERARQSPPDAHPRHAQAGSEASAGGQIPLVGYLIDCD